jgi:hypothetical protein
VIGLSEKNSYLSQIGNADEVTACFGIPYSYAADGAGAKSVVNQTSCYEKMCVTVMLVVLADCMKLPSHVILNHKKCLRSICIEEQCSDANLKVGWKDWLLVEWNRGPGNASL